MDTLIDWNWLLLCCLIVGFSIYMLPLDLLKNLEMKNNIKIWHLK